MSLDIGKRGAIRQSFTVRNIRQVITTLQADNPRASEHQLSELLSDLALEDDDVRFTCCEYAVRNWKNSVEHMEVRSKLKPLPEMKEVRKQRAHKTEQLGIVADKVVNQIILMNQTMPNGKPMKDCSGPEMVSFGGAYIKIGKKVGDGKVVSSVFNEGQIRAIVLK